MSPPNIRMRLFVPLTTCDEGKSPPNYKTIRFAKRYMEEQDGDAKDSAAVALAGRNCGNVL